MNWKTIALPLGLGMVVLAVGTLVEARFTDRWVKMDSAMLDRFAKAVEKVPKKIGKWEGTDDPISDEEFRLTNCAAYVSRQYVNQETGDRITMYLVAGTARHITIHTPDRCYRGSGFNQDGKVESYVMELDGALPTNPEFSTAVFSKPDNAQRVFWTYSDDGSWYGPGSSNIAKVKFGGRPALYKIYLIGPPSSPEESVANDFAREVFPKVNSILFAPSSPDAGEVSEDDLSIS
ncbi:MAG: exosortase-associated EpsI family protein [Planctomycetota bacterium]